MTSKRKPAPWPAAVSSAVPPLPSINRTPIECRDDTACNLGPDPAPALTINPDATLRDLVYGTNSRLRRLFVLLDALLAAVDPDDEELVYAIVNYASEAVAVSKAAVERLNAEERAEASHG